jgi:hypothetical protein
MIGHMLGFNMFFKSKWVMGLILINFIGVLSCQKFVNDEPEKPRVLQVDMENKKCLDKITQVFSDYFQQKFVKSDWDETWSCMDQSIAEFMNGTRGEKENLYQASELKRFFKKLFKHVFKREITDELVDEIMKLKQSLIGGESDNITRIELEKLRLFFGLLAKEMESLTPHLGVLLFRDNLNVKVATDQQRVEGAIAALRQSILAILKNSSFSESTYSLPEIKLLMEEVEKFVGDTDPDNAFAKWRKKLPFLEKIRGIFIGSTIEIRDSHEVEKIWMLLVDAFRAAIYFSKGINKVEFDNPGDFQILDDWVEANFVILLDTFQWKKKQEILYEDLDFLVDELSKEDFWPKKLSVDTFKITYRRFITRGLDDNRNDKLTALSYEHILQLRREYRTYKLIQKILIEDIFIENSRWRELQNKGGLGQAGMSKDFNDGSSLSAAIVKARFYNVNVKDRIRSASQYTLGEEKLYTKAWEKFMSIVNSPTYVRHWNAEGQLILDSSQQQVNWNYRDLWLMNIYRWGVQALIRGYALEPKRIVSQEYMTKKELEEVYTEFELFCNEMGIFDPRTVETYSRSLKEGDLFTLGGNGDNLLQLEEVVDLFTMMYSGGMVSVKNIYRYAEMDKHLLPSIDFFKNHYISFAGYFDTLRRHFGEIFPNLPGFSKYVQSLNDIKWQRFYDNILSISRLCPDDQVGVETADNRTLATVINYIEALFVIYDRNHSGTFDLQEAEMAYERFADFIIDVTKKQVQKSNPDVYEAIEFTGYQWRGLGLDVFKYMIFNGSAPSGDELLGFIWDDFWGKHKFEEADRSQITRVFATLKAEISKNPPKCELHGMIPFFNDFQF